MLNIYNDFPSHYSVNTNVATFDHTYSTIYFSNDEHCYR